MAIRRAANRVVAMGVLVTAAVTVQAEDDWEVRLGLDSEYTDNANKSEEATLSEREDQALIGLSGNYENETLLLDAGYQVRERRFSKGSEEDRTLYEGEGRFVLGKGHDPAQLSISHSRDTVWNTPDALEQLENTDERDIVTVVPSLRWQPTGVDDLQLSGQFSDIGYRYNEQRDSERRGGQLSWIRQLSEVSQFSVSAQQTEIAFDAAPSADYTYRDYHLAYEVTLRKLSYRLQAGLNESEPETGEALSSPAYLVSVSYGEPVNRVELRLRRYITDNSAGSSNRSPLSSFGPDDSSAGDLDQIERERAEINWQYQALCQRCSVSTTLYYQEDDYRQEAEDRTQSGGSINLGYQLSQRGDLSLSWRRNEQSFADDVARTGYQSDRWRLSYRYSFPAGLDVTLSASRIDREADAGGRSYVENRGGLGLDYRF